MTNFYVLLGIWGKNGYKYEYTTSNQTHLIHDQFYFMFGLSDLGEREIEMSDMKKITKLFFIWLEEK